MVSSKRFRLPTSFQSHIVLRVRLPLPQHSVWGIRYLVCTFCHLPEQSLLLSTTNLSLQSCVFMEADTHLGQQPLLLTGSRVFCHFTSSSLCDGPGTPTSHMWPHFLNSHHARRGRETSWKHVFLCRFPVPRKQQRALGLGSLLCFLHYTRSS